MDNNGNEGGVQDTVEAPKPLCGKESRWFRRLVGPDNWIPLP